MANETKNRITAAQIAVLCSFFEDNPEVVCGYKKTSKGKDAVQAKWKSITPHLNSLGLPRDYRAWAKYLCNLKAKLKKKRVKWKQNTGGSNGMVMVNVEDFNEIELRMFQILKKHKSNSQEPQCDSSSSDMELEDMKLDDLYEETSPVNDISVKYTDNKDNNTISNETNSIYIRLPNETMSPEPPLFTKSSEFGDEFDSFGKNVAQQLRTLPLGVALETEEMIISLLRKQRLKIFNK